MPKPIVLQVGPYPEWDQEPLDAAFDVKRLFEAEDAGTFLAEHGPDIRAIATRGELFIDFMPHFKTFMQNLKTTIKSALNHST